MKTINTEQLRMFFFIIFFYYEYFPVMKRLQQMRERAGADLIKGGGRLNYWIKLNEQINQIKALTCD